MNTAPSPLTTISSEESNFEVINKTSVEPSTIPNGESKNDSVCTLDNSNPSSSLCRRSIRNPHETLLEKADVKSLLNKIKTNHPDTVVLKIKDHMNADINSTVLEEIISSLYKNRICQALYAQNLSKAMTDRQLRQLIELLKKRKIWCLNLGENYEVSTEGWMLFCEELPNTYVTHLYVSEHTISINLKNEMRFHIRQNRQKHDRHKSVRNLKVISKCTNMWW
jgi:hypothetical protein